MSDSSQFTDWDVEVQYGGRKEVLAIKAPNKKAAENYAAFMLRQRRKRIDSKVIGAKEKTKKP